MVLMASFAAIALVLTEVGTYWLLSYAVAKRRDGVAHRAWARRRDVLGWSWGKPGGC
jgi:hypothetical protein